MDRVDHDIMKKETSICNHERFEVLMVVVMKITNF
jgi:hypothetical protein